MKPSPLALRPREPLLDWIHRCSAGLLLPTLRRAQQAAPLEQAETIHLLRVATKRLRALLRLLEPALSEADFTRQTTRLRQAAARLAPSRDRAVARQTLAALLKSPKARPHRASLRLLAQLHPNPSLPTSLAPATHAIAASTHDLAQSYTFFQALALPDPDWQSIAPGLQATYRRARRRWKKARHLRDESSLHRWRLAVKQLSYQLTWLQPIWPKVFAPHLKQLRRLEQKLGAAHDLAQLQPCLPTSAPTQAQALALAWLTKTIRQRCSQLQTRCFALGKSLFALPSKRFQHHCRRRWLRWLPPKTQRHKSEIAPEK